MASTAMRVAAVLKFKETGGGVCSLEAGCCCILDDIESNSLTLGGTYTMGKLTARMASKWEEEACQCYEIADRWMSDRVECRIISRIRAFWAHLLSCVTTRHARSIFLSRQPASREI